MALKFNHPIEEWYWMNNISIPEVYTQYKQHRRAGLVFELCSCSMVNPAEIHKLSGTKSPFLKKLVADMTYLPISFIGPYFKPYRINYLKLAHDIATYKVQEDTYVQSCIALLKNQANPKPQIVSLGEHIQLLGIEPGWDYILMHYLENAGYCSHGINITSAFWDPTNDTVALEADPSPHNA